MGVNKIGRPRKRLPANTTVAEMVEKIRAASAAGVSKKNIAWSIGTTPRVLNRFFEDHPALGDAFDAGNARNEGALVTVVMKAALGGDVNAAQWMLRHKHGWRENGASAAAGGMVAITFNMPDAIPLKDFMEMQSGSTDDGHQPVSVSRPLVTQ